MIVTLPCTHPYFLDFIHQEKLEQILTQLPSNANSSFVFLYMEGLDVLGCAVLTENSTQQNYMNKNSLWVNELFVKAEKRSRGIGKMIMDSIIYYAQNKYEDLYFHTQSAQRFYENRWIVHFLGENLINHEKDIIPGDFFRLNIQENATNHEATIFNLDDLFLEFCKNNNLIAMQDVFSCSYIHLNALDKKGLNAILIAASHGYLDILHYLVSISEDKHIHYQTPEGYNALTYACGCGHLDIVQYLLTSKDLAQRFDIHHKNIFNISMLMHACSNGHTDIVDYLLSSKELTEHANLLDKDNYHMNALTWSFVNANHYELAQKLIIDYDMFVDEQTKESLKTLSPNTLKIIQTRELHQKINNELPNHNPVMKNRKI